jgi:hypothetical protein
MSDVTIIACNRSATCEACHSRKAVTSCSAPLSGRLEGQTCGRALCRWCAGTEAREGEELCPPHRRAGAVGQRTKRCLMPIKPENRHLYGPNWPAISRRIRERAGQRCERCGAPNGTLIARAPGQYMLEDGRVYDDTTGEHLGIRRGSEFPATRFVKVVLTVAHLDQDAANHDESNLRAYCQQCHLRHDARDNAAKAAETRAAKREAESGQVALFGRSDG